jgi:hypothetical protein
MKLTTVESKMIHAVGYDAETQTMEVIFNNGRAYLYEEVSRKTYKELMAAESKGQYLRDKIIKKFPFQKILPAKKNNPG